MSIEIHIDDHALDRLAEQIADRLNQTNGARTPWMDAHQAATYLGCPVSRVRKLTSTGELPVHRDGRRTLYRRDDLDDYVLGGGAISP